MRVTITNYSYAPVLTDVDNVILKAENSYFGAYEKDYGRDYLGQSIIHYTHYFSFAYPIHPMTRVVLSKLERVGDQPILFSFSEDWPLPAFSQCLSELNTLFPKEYPQ